MITRVLLLALAFLAVPIHVHAAPTSNAAIDWAQIVQPSIHSATAPRSGGSAQVLHTMVMLAMYDAVVAIEGGYRPYAAAIPAWRRGDVRAAAATAAYLTARARVAASQVAYLDQEYAAYLGSIPDGAPKREGVRVGAAAAEAMLALRADDGFDNTIPYACSATPPEPGEFVPDTGCPTHPGAPQPADVKIGQVRPFTFDDPTQFRPRGPAALTSESYADDFLETRDYGRIDSAVRSPEQTDVAYFWAEHPYVHWNRNLISLAKARCLSTRDAAHFFALVHTAASDAVIAGFEAKYYYTSWRPRTAIPLADLDGNDDTDADPTWKPLLSVNHPEYPSGHAFWSTAVLDAVSHFFGTDRVRWTITTSKSAVPQLVQTERTYTSMNALGRQIEDARIWAGLHFRRSMQDGERLGHRVTRHVTRNFFQPLRRW